MPIDKAAIAEALQTLDHTNDTLWTDDGSPLVSEVQRLVNDKTVTRAQINDAIPGFTRKSTAAIDEATQAPVVAQAPDPEVVDHEPEANVANADTLSTEEVRAILTRRVREAENALADARKATAAAQRHEHSCEARLNRAIFDHQRKFPPISAAANIKSHLEAQGRLAEQRAGIAHGDTRAQIDITMDVSKRRGWARPTRSVLGNNAA